jgi:hypothetical protein
MLKNHKNTLKCHKNTFKIPKNAIKMPKIAQNRLLRIRNPWGQTECVHFRLFLL